MNLIHNMTTLKCGKVAIETHQEWMAIITLGLIVISEEEGYQLW